MDNAIEQNFVKTFIDKKYQDRFIFELSSPKKRIDAIHRFAHNAEAIINPKYVLSKSNTLTEQEIEKEIAKIFNIKKECYMISDSEDFDGTFQPFSIGLKGCMDGYMPSIIICGENVALIKTEAETGSPTKYILYKK